MKYSLVLAFAASALAQYSYNTTAAATSTGCASVVTVTTWEYVTTCPCDTSTTLSTATTSNSLSTSASSSNGVGPISGSTTATSSGTTATTSASGSSSASSSSTTSSSSQVGQPTFTSSSLTSTSSATSSTPTATAAINCAAVGLPPPGSTVTSAVQSVQTLDISVRDLIPHNTHRRNASIVELTWSTALQASAQQLASSCIYGHNTTYGGGGYGQNIGAGFGQYDTPIFVTNALYNGEINNYPGPYGSNNVDTSNFDNWGHYSQLVWTSTTQVGCAWADCTNNPGGLQNFGTVDPYFTVCNYAPAGNVVGDWSQVAAPGGCGTIVWVDNS